MRNTSSKTAIVTAKQAWKSDPSPREASTFLDDQELRENAEHDDSQEHGILETLDDVPAVGDRPSVELVENLSAKHRNASRVKR